MCESLLETSCVTDFSLSFYTEYKLNTAPEVDEAVIEPLVAGHEENL